MWKVAIAVGLAVTITGCQPKPPALAVKSNTPQKLDFFYSVNEDCTSVGKTLVQVTAQPANGKVEIRYGKDYPVYREDSPRKACNKILVESTQVWYAPNPGFLGTDGMKIVASFPAGPPKEFTYQVVVK